MLRHLNSIVCRRAVERCLSTATASSPAPTAVVMMNLGGPATLDEVHPFLLRLFSDGDLIPLPFQSVLARWIAKRRTPSIEAQYKQIGGGSPILKWTRAQGEAMVRHLDEMSPHTAPHKAYVAFRYASPLTEDCLAEMQHDGVTRAVAFSQYPQYSCSTTGSSLNYLAQMAKERPELMAGIQWSVLDRWPLDKGFIKATVELIERHLSRDTDNAPVIVFSAHSLPLSVVERGDPYPHEVAATVHAVMEQLPPSLSFRLVWQSKVGPTPWLTPATDTALKGLAQNGTKRILVVPIAFTSDHIETLYELDLEYIQHLKKTLSIDIERCAALNAEETFTQALATLVAGHLQAPRAALGRLALRCPMCSNPRCVQMREVFCQ